MSGDLAAIGLVEPAAGALLAQLARASLAGGVLAAAVWGLVRLAPRLPAAWRCALWCAVSLKLVVALIWAAPVELPLLPAADPEVPALAAAAVPSPAGGLRETGQVRAEGGEPAAAPGGTSFPGPPGAPSELPWRPALALIWLLGVAAGAAGIGRDLAAVRRLVRESRPAEDPVLRARFDALRERLGVRTRVALRLSDRVPSPLTAGLLRPAVVLPARAPEELPPEELELALAHELLHVRRRDLWTGWVPVVAGRLFFFHPLAALAAREYRLAREGACDAAVVRELRAAPRAYGRLLLRWTHAPAPGTALAAGAASPSYLDLKRRLAMLHDPSPFPRSVKLLAWSAALLAVAALVPVRIVAAPPAPPTAPAPPEAPAAPQPPEAPESRIAALAPEAPEAPVAPEPPEPPEAPEPPDHDATRRGALSEGSHGYSYAWSGDGEAWALVEGDSHVWMSGDHRQMRRARRYQGETAEPLLWIERDGREYVIRDPETVERAQEILEPSRELGRRQGELGARQGELGAQQGELGARQGELGAQQGELGARQAGLAAEQAALAAERAALAARRASDGSGAEDRARRVELDAEMKELSRRMRELGERQAELGHRQRELARPQQELGRRQAELGARQAALGEQQRAASGTARVEIRELIDRAIEQGLAEPVSSDR